MDVVFGYGQVGQALVAELVARGRKVRVVSRSGSGPRVRGVDHVRGDATDDAFCRAMCAGAEVVYVCMNAPYDQWAAMYPPLQAAVVEGAESARCKLVVLENLYMYGPHEGPLTESLPLAATEEKGRTRARMSEALLAAHRRGAARVAIGRASDFFGPGVITSQLGERAFGPLVLGKAASTLGDPDTRHSFAYVPDVARALATLGDREEADGKVWHLPCVETLTTREMMRRAGALAGTRGDVSPMPRALVSILSRVHPMVREIDAIRYQHDEDFVVDSSAFEAAFDVHATPLEDALGATVRWYRERPRATSRLPQWLGTFALDNVLIGLAAIAVAALIHAVPALSSLSLGIAVAAGLYWLPPVRRAALDLAARLFSAPPSTPTTLEQRSFEGPGTKIRILESALESGGARLRFEQTVVAGGARPPRHVHRRQTESFTVRSGRLALEANGRVRELGPGESLSIPPGVSHTFWNVGDGPCVHEVMLEPAENMERFFEGILTLEAQHRLPPHGRPDLLRIALLFGEYDNVVAGVPRFLQRGLYAVARALAWSSGASAPRWSEVERIRPL